MLTLSAFLPLVLEKNICNVEWDCWISLPLVNLGSELKFCDFYKTIMMIRFRAISQIFYMHQFNVTNFCRSELTISLLFWVKIYIHKVLKAIYQVILIMVYKYLCTRKAEKHLTYLNNSGIDEIFGIFFDFYLFSNGKLALALL